ncbi:MAG: VOC family protein [Pseudomonadota bacterium]
MFKRIAHVCLDVKDLQRSIDYYSKLGFKTKFQFTRKGQDFGVYLEIAENNYIEIFENKDLGPVINNGLKHFCLEADDLDLVMKNLTAQGVDFTEKKLGCDNTWQIWLKDPDGNAFEVHQYTATSAQQKGQVVEADW